MPSSNFFRDEDFQERMLQFVCRDRNFLKRTGGVLDSDDFKPRHGEGSSEAYIIALKAFRYWRDYREPIGGMLRHEILDYISQHKKKVGTKSREKLMEMVNNIRNANGLVAVEAIENKIFEYKQRKKMGDAIREMISMKENGALTPVAFLKLCRKAVEEGTQGLKIYDYVEEKELERRILRRQKERNRRYPQLYIEQFDRAIRTFPRKNIGILLAKYKTGKSTAAVYLDQAFALQGLNVLHFTLEDPAEDVEDKLDASFAGIKIKLLNDKSRKVRRRILRSLQRLRARIKVVDGVDAGMTVPRLEEMWETQRNQGFAADVVIVDADEGLEPVWHHSREQGGDTRESKEIYKDLKHFAARRDIYLWVTAQTQRGKKGQRQMIVTGDDSATDISKVRRCALCIGIGDGPEDWGEDARYIYIAAHRYDKGKIGFPIMGDFARGIFYSREKTELAIRRSREEKE